MQRQNRQQTYKRITRVREIIRAAKGELNAYLPPRVLNLVRRNLTRYNVREEDVDPFYVRRVLKKLKLRSRFGDQAVAIAMALGATPSKCCLSLSKSEQKIIETLFLKLDGAWPKVKEKIRQERGWMRITFLNYGFVLAALLYRIGLYKQSEFVSKYFALQTPELRHRQEFLYKLLCEQLHWNFDFLGGNLITDGKHRVPHALHLKYGGASY